MGVIMEVNEVFEKVKGLFEEELGIESEKITMEAKLEEDLEIDSLGIVEVVMAFEDEFEIEIDDEELTDVGTVGQAVNLLHSKL
ncbi:acyl carrier protein [Acidimicrobiaceae bacterium]|nr:acyl carrier protein [Acidimicrobiaceae bacterium]